MDVKENPSSKTSVLQDLPHRESQVSACGKAIVCGEHAVVYGTHAVAVPLKSMRLHLTLTPLPRTEKPVIQLTLAQHDASPRVKGVLLDAMKIMGAEPFSLNAKSSNSLPIGAGLGSSATLCVASLRALAASLEVDLPTARLASLANDLEKRFHGTPSGLDAAVVAYEACILFAKEKPIRPVQLRRPHLNSPWRFALIDSGIRASTMAMIRIAEPYFRGRSGDRHLKTFDELSWQVYGALQQGDAPTVGAAMDECSSLLKAAGVVPESLQDIIKICRSVGVLGSKTTGAGGGGMIICLLDQQVADLQIEALRAKLPGLNIYPTEVDI